MCNIVFPCSAAARAEGGNAPRLTGVAALPGNADTGAVKGGLHKLPRWRAGSGIRQYEEPPVVATTWIRGNPHTTYNTQEADMESVAYVGMDVDKKKIAMAVIAGYEPQPRIQRIVPNNLAAIQKFFGELTGQYENVCACYEAGACGFELYRRVTEMTVACAVVAPTSIPRKTNDRIKTDRRDAVKLAVEFRNGNLSPVYVPSRRDEAARDYLRLYEDVKMDLRTAKQRPARGEDASRFPSPSIM